MNMEIIIVIFFSLLFEFILDTGERRKKIVILTHNDFILWKQFYIMFFSIIYFNFLAYHCSYCSRSFSQSNDLTKHIRSHVGLNMYRCHCGASFRLQTELRKHSYTHYNQNEPIKSIDEQKQ